MKKLLIAAVLGLSALAGGCSSYCPNLVESGYERHNRLQLIHNVNCRELVDDWDFFWLQDRNSYLTYWHPRVPY